MLSLSLWYKLRASLLKNLWGILLDLLVGKPWLFIHSWFINSQTQKPGSEVPSQVLWWFGKWRSFFCLTKKELGVLFQTYQMSQCQICELLGYHCLPPWDKVSHFFLQPVDHPQDAILSTWLEYNCDQVVVTIFPVGLSKNQEGFQGLKCILSDLFDLSYRIK